MGALEAMSGGNDPEIVRLERRLARERAAREQAEQLLERKSAELYEVNLDLEQKVCEIERHITRERHAARHCALTGLANRAAVTERLEALFGGTDHALILIDVDRFKIINDTSGHHAGDAVLRATAERLRALCPKGALAARIGADEFVVILETAGPEQARRLAADLQTSIAQPVEHGRGTAQFTVSMGIGCAHPEQDHAGGIYLEADLALYRAKLAGRGHRVLFDDTMRSDAARRRTLSEGFFGAIRSRQFHPHYMPRVHASSGKLACVEALARWEHPELGPVRPDEFLRVAEALGQVAAIDKLIYEAAAADLESWRKRGIAVPKVSVNVSSKRLMEDDLLEAVEGFELDGGAMSFEILESVFLDDADDQVRGRLDALRAHGIGIEIDDFGSGHASINGLISVRPNGLKIDRRLVDHALAAERGEEVLASVVAIGRALGLNVVAEGVETEAHVELCTRMGCDQLQGWAIARAMPADDLAQWIQNGMPRSA